MSKIYNIKDFGAKVCDRLQTEFIQSAIDKCFIEGGGTVVIPKGIFKTGTVRIRSNVHLHLESGAILEGSHNPEDYFSYLNDELEPIETTEELINRLKGRSVYPFSRWSNAIIRACGAKNISITGEKGSYINGVDCYDEQGEEGYRGPHAISFHNCENIYLEGYTIMNSANWAHNICVSQNITAKNLTVYGGHDGFDARTCDNILIEDCEFRTGDDAIAGFDNNDVIIRNCILDCSCSALRFGGNNILVENCHSYSPGSFGHRYTLTKEQQKLSAPTDEKCRHNMLTSFLYYCDFRAEIRKTPGDILIRNCIFENPDSLFKLEFDGEHVWCCNRSLSSITFENCRVTGVREPIHIHGDENEPLNIKLKEVSITTNEEFSDLPVIDAVNFERIDLEDVTFEGYKKPTIIAKSKGEIIGDVEVIMEV